LQARHGPSQAVLQQTPATQKPEAQSTFWAQVAPTARTWQRPVVSQ
jgi:hypothetical protein